MEIKNDFPIYKLKKDEPFKKFHGDDSIGMKKVDVQDTLKKNVDELYKRELSRQRQAFEKSK